jgi:hypothetical protein
MFDRWHSYQLSEQLARERTARSIGQRLCHSETIAAMTASAERATALTAIESRYHFEGSVQEKISK